MHQMVKTPADTSRRWWVLAIVVSAQFMFGVDAFIVNVAIPTIAAELHASPAEIEAVIAIYLIAYATLVVTGGRLGDIFGTKIIFIAGVAGFALTSLWCGLAQSGPELILARLAQGATAALMVPQVLATLHLLFADSARARAFAIYGVVLGLAGAAGFALGGLLVTIDLAGLGWRSVFFVNVPFGIAIIAAALWIVPSVPRRLVVRFEHSHPAAGATFANARIEGPLEKFDSSGALDLTFASRTRGNVGANVKSTPLVTRLDIRGAIVLFAGLLCLIGPLLFGHDLRWAAWIWLVMASGAAIVAFFLKLERSVAARGGMPLIDLALLADRAFMRGLAAVFFFFFANLSFYLVITMFMQKALHIPPLQGGLVFLPLALAFVIASRHSGARARHRGTLVLIEGCALQVAGLALLAATLAWNAAPSAALLALVLIVFGYGQGLVMAPLSSAVLASVKPQAAGSASGIYGTTTHIANAAGVAVIGAVFFAAESVIGARPALFIALALFVLAILISAAFLSWMRRA
jgi:MFS family permease